MELDYDGLLEAYNLRIEECMYKGKRIEELEEENKKLKEILNRIKELYEDEEEAELLNYLDEILDEI